MTYLIISLAECQLNFFFANDTGGSTKRNPRFSKKGHKAHEGKYIFVSNSKTSLNQI